MFSKKFFIPVLILIISFCIMSCSKKNEDTSGNDKKTAEFTDVDDNDVNESNNDLQSVDYKDIYDKLSSKGEWVQVSSSDIGLDDKKSTTSNDEFQRSLISFITGVSDVNAADANPGLVFVWKPADNLAVSLSNDQPAAYVPYSNGQWVNTDAGWYFKAPTPEEEIVHHYGRWAYTDAGWVWVPGRVWAPAWVDWREDDNNIAWAPVPPSVYIVNNTLPVPVINEERYVVVGKKFFVEPAVYKYYDYSINRVVLKNWGHPEGIVLGNKKIINRGPDVKVIETFYGKPIEVVQINHVKDYDKVKYSDKEFTVYTPGFKKLKNTEKITTASVQPKSFVKYEDAKVKYKKDKEVKGQDDKKVDNGDPRDNKTMHEDKNKKLGDDRDMHKDKENKGKENGNKENGKEKGNEKHEKENKDNGNKDKGNHDKGEKDNGNKDKGHGKK